MSKMFRLAFKFLYFIRIEFLTNYWLTKQVIASLDGASAGIGATPNTQNIPNFVQEDLVGKFSWEPQKTLSVLSPIWSDIAQAQWVDLLNDFSNSEKLIERYSNFVNSPLIAGIDDNVSMTRSLHPAHVYYCFRFFSQMRDYARERNLLPLNFFHQPEKQQLLHQLSELPKKLGSELSVEQHAHFRGLELDDVRFPTDVFDAAYFAKFVVSMISIGKLNKAKRSFAELGGGSGLLAVELLKNLNDHQYTVIDLVPFLTWQYNIIGDRCVYMPAECVEQWSGEFTTLINQDSFPEIPENVLEVYIQKLLDLGVEEVISYNQRSLYKNQTDHVNVLLRNGFELLYSQSSAVRKGYFLEYYRLNRESA